MTTWVSLLICFKNKIFFLKKLTYIYLIWEHLIIPIYFLWILSSKAILKSWPRLFKERITLIQRINRYPVDKIYPLTPFGLFKTWIALSSHYPLDKFIQVKVGCITFYPVDKIVVVQRWPPVVPGGVLGSIFAGYVPLASPNPYPIIVYSVANHRPHLSHFWANVIFAIPT